MGKTTNPRIQALIDYLEVKLIDEASPHHVFTKPAPRTFYFTDDVDTIFVRIDDVNIIIITDGDNVVNSFVSKPHFANGAYDKEDYEPLFNPTLQDILRFF